MQANVNYNNNAPVTNRTNIESALSAVSWSAVFAGALTAAAASLILLLLGSALGFASLSPWSPGPSAAAIGISTALGLIFMQLVASGVGGYLTGRLRSKWVNVHGDEVFFRDTAHGFLAWAVATVLTAACLTSAISTVASGTATAATTVVAGAAAGASYGAAKNVDMRGGWADPTGYFVDTLYRTDSRVIANSDSRPEATRILVNAARTGTLPEADKAQLAQLVSQNTGLSYAESTQRVDQTIAKIDEAKAVAKQKLDKARKAAAQLSLYAFLSMLIGAFVASAAAALGGKHRDQY